MKTRNIIAILAALPIMAGFTGCKSDDELSAVASKDMLIVEGGNIELRSGDELKNVTITANCGWQLNVIQDTNNPWSSLSVQPQRGSGNGTLVIMSDQNTSIFDRLDTIMLVSDGGLRQKIALRQKSGNSNSSWSIQTPAGINWMHVDKTSGASGATTVNVTADPIQTDATRSTSFTILYGTSSAEVQVIQTGMNSDDIYLSAPVDQMGFTAEGGEQMLRVESNAEWNAYIPSSVSWVHIEGMQEQREGRANASGVGNGEVRVYCEPNNSTNDRLTAIVLIAGTKDPKQVIVLVEQSGVGAPESTVTVGDLTSLYVADKSAEFRFSFSSDQEVIDYGLVYSRENREPTRWNAEVKTVGQGGFTRSVLGTLDNLEPNTTYYVRAYVLGKTGQDNFYYSPNVVTIRTSDNSREPGESDNPDPSLAPRR